jgi:hypothetical protein
MADLFDHYRVIDADSHLSEPADVWTSRVSGKWGSLDPCDERYPRRDC